MVEHDSEKEFYKLRSQLCSDSELFLASSILKRDFTNKTLQGKVKDQVEHVQNSIAQTFRATLNETDEVVEEILTPHFKSMKSLGIVHCDHLDENTKFFLSWAYGIGYQIKEPDNLWATEDIIAFIGLLYSNDGSYTWDYNERLGWIPVAQSGAEFYKTNPFTIEEIDLSRTFWNREMHNIDFSSLTQK